MKKRKLLVTSNKCPLCRKVKNKLSDKLEAGEVKELNISSSDSDSVDKLLEEKGIKEVPKAIELKEDKYKKLKEEGVINE